MSRKRLSHRIGPQDVLPAPTLDQQRLWKPLLQLAESRLYESVTSAMDETDSGDLAPSLTQDLAIRLVLTLQTLAKQSGAAATKRAVLADADPAELDADFLMLPETGSLTASGETAAGQAEATKERKTYMLSLISWLVYFWQTAEEDLVLEEPQKAQLRKLILLSKKDILEATAGSASSGHATDKMPSLAWR